MEKLYLHTCFIRFDFWIYSRYTESFSVVSFNKKQVKLKNGIYIILLKKFLKKEPEVTELFKKYWLKNWEVTSKEVKEMPQKGISPNYLIFDEVATWQDSQPEKKLVKRI